MSRSIEYAHGMHVDSVTDESQQWRMLAHAITWVEERHQVDPVTQVRGIRMAWA